MKLNVLRGSVVTDFDDVKEVRFEEISMFRKTSTAPLLLWLLVAQFLSQIEENSTIPLSKVKFQIMDNRRGNGSFFILSHHLFFTPSH